jgi:hypothetical protein
MVGSSKQRGSTTLPHTSEGPEPMTTFRTTAIAAIAAITIAASMASPANALSKKGAIALGAFSALAVGAAVASAHARNGYYEEDHGYRRGGRAYRRAVNRCADRFGMHTYRFDICMERRGF